MSVDNYWGTLPSSDSIVTPDSILRQQAEVLNELSNGLLRAVLDVRTGASRQSLEIDLDIHADALNYFVTVLTLSSGALLYPVTVKDRLEGREHVCKNEEEFRAVLKDVLSSQVMRDTITALIGRSRSVSG